MSLPDFASLLPKLQAAVDFAGIQVRRMVESHPHLFAVYTRGGQWQSAATNSSAECAGCLPAIMWVLSDVTGEAFWREQAEVQCRRMDSTWTDLGQPGIGYAMYFGGFRRWYEVSVAEGLPEPHVHERLIAAAEAMTQRLQTPGGYLHGDGGASGLSLFSLLDTPLMFFAANQTQDSRLADLASRHCAMIRKWLVRGDGSVASDALMDPQTGECRGWTTQIGMRADSCWSRGLAWAILGFATVGGLLEFEPWLETARRSAAYLIERLSGQPIPPWDFDVPADRQPPRDTSAAAIAALGLLVLADAEHHVGSEQARQRQRLQETALWILDALCGPEYLASSRPGWPGILMQGVGNLPAGWAVGESVIWGDAFFVQALHRAILLLRKRF